MEREIKVKQGLYKAISEYCSVNSIEDVDGFVERCIINGFNTIRFGSSPIDNVRREKDGIKDFSKNEKPAKNEGTEEGKPSRKPRKKNQGPEETNNVEAHKEGEQVKVRKIRIIKKD